jgi:hypothetical protein
VRRAADLQAVEVDAPAVLAPERPGVCIGIGRDDDILRCIRLALNSHRSRLQLWPVDHHRTGVCAVGQLDRDVVPPRTNFPTEAPLYRPDGERISKSNMTLGQAI